VARVLGTAALLLALVLPAGTRAANGFVFDRAGAAPNDRVTVRTRDFAPSARLYLVRSGSVPAVRSRTDRRLSFIGTLARDRRGSGALTFSMPPLDAGTYELASWSRGKGVSLQRSARLQLRTTSSCPVTRPNGSRPPGQPRSVNWYGNGLLWAGVERDGTYAVPQDRVGADGSIGNKLLWVTTPPWERPTISGERIDGDAPPLQVIRVNTGSFSEAVNPSHMSPVGFPIAGCWRVTARLGDVSLVYVVRVEVATG
jgi:hypothetical protein